MECLECIIKDDLHGLLRCFLLNPHIVHEVVHSSTDNDKWDTLLHQSCVYNNIKAISTLLDFHADINAMDSAGYTPFMLAISLNNEFVAHMLLNRGCDIYLLNEVGVNCNF
jgi:ankyrin repeat protein